MGKLGIARTANRPRPNNNRQSTQNRESGSQLAFNLSAKSNYFITSTCLRLSRFYVPPRFFLLSGLILPSISLAFPPPRAIFAPLYASQRPTSCATPLYIPQPTEFQSTFWAQHLFFVIEVLLALQKAETLKIKRADYYT